MSIELLDGFSVYRSATDVVARYTGLGDTSILTLDTTGGLAGNTGSLRFAGGEGVYGGIKLDLALAKTDFNFGFRWRLNDWDAAAGSTDRFLNIGYNTSSAMVEFSIGENGAFRLYLNSAEVWDSSDDGWLLDYDRDYMFECAFNPGTSNDGVVKLYIDGVLVYETASTDFLSNDSDYFWVHTGETGDGADFTISDLYVTDDVTDGLLYGNWMVEALTVDADTAQADFTPINGGTNVAEIDESNGDGDISYNYSSTTTHEDRFTTTETLASLVAKVIAVKVAMLANEDTSAANMRLTCYENLTKGSGASQSVVAGGADVYAPYDEVFSVNPDTSAAWTKTEVEGAEFGYEVL